MYRKTKNLYTKKATPKDGSHNYEQEKLFRLLQEQRLPQPHMTVGPFPLTM